MGVKESVEALCDVMRENALEGVAGLRQAAAILEASRSPRFQTRPVTGRAEGSFYGVAILDARGGVEIARAWRAEDAALIAMLLNRQAGDATLAAAAVKLGIDRP